MKINEIVILAGGLGTRLRKVVSSVPKPLAIVNGKPFLFHLLEFWINQGINKIVLAVGYKHEIIIHEVKNSTFSPYVCFSIEKKELGTGGAIIKSLDLIKNDNFIAQNGDTYVPIKLELLIKGFKNCPKSSAFIAVVNGTDEKRYKLLSISKNNLISQFHNNIRYRGINSGLYILNKYKLLDKKYEKYEKISFENTILNDLIAKNDCSGAFFEAPFIDIGIPEDYYKAHDIIKVQDDE